VNRPTEKPRLLKILYELDLPKGQWVLSGSGTLVMHGIERDRPMGDVDIFLATRPWFELLYKGMENAFFDAPTWRVYTTDPDDPARRVDPPYIYRMMHGLEVNIFHGWRKRGIGDIDVGFWLNNTEIVDGIPCLPVKFLLDWKEQMGRAKDQTDIESIKKWMETNT